MIYDLLTHGIAALFGAVWVSFPCKAILQKANERYQQAVMMNKETQRLAQELQDMVAKLENGGLFK